MTARLASPQLLLPFLLGVSFAACDGATATDPQLSNSASVAEMPGSSADDGMVPYRERMTSAPAPDALPVVCEPAFAGVVLPSSLVAAGVATHLGKTNGIVTGTSCTVDASGVISIGGLAQRTAANGDILEAEWTGTIVGDVLTLSVTFTGGTGRFEDAAGWAAGRGTVDPSGVSAWTLKGRITPPLAGGPETALTTAQVAGRYTLQTYNGDALPLALRSTYAGIFKDDAGLWLTTPFSIDERGLLTLQTFYTVTFLGPGHPPGMYAVYPPAQEVAPRTTVDSGSFVIGADLSCSVSWAISGSSLRTSTGTCQLTREPLEWTNASLVLSSVGTWTATTSHRTVAGVTITRTDVGHFKIHGGRIVFTPALTPIFPSARPDCPTTATLAADVLTTVVQCPGLTQPQETAVWQR